MKNTGANGFETLKEDGTDRGEKGMNREGGGKTNSVLGQFHVDRDHGYSTSNKANIQ